MSTKQSIVYDDCVHFYKDMLDESHVHLEITHPCGHTDEVAIPLYVWEGLRRHQVTDFSLANKTPKQIREDVGKEVYKHIEQYAAVTPDGFGTKAMYQHWGYDKPYDEQFKKLLGERLEERQRQLQILQQAKKLREKQKR